MEYPLMRLWSSIGLAQVTLFEAWETKMWERVSHAHISGLEGEHT